MPSVPLHCCPALQPDISRQVRATQSPRCTSIYEQTEHTSKFEVNHFFIFTKKSATDLYNKLQIHTALDHRTNINYIIEITRIPERILKNKCFVKNRLRHYRQVKVKKNRSNRGSKFSVVQKSSYNEHIYPNLQLRPLWKRVAKVFN